MDRETMTLKCVRCNKQFRMLEMVVDSSGRGMSCRPCAGLAPKKVDTPFARQKIVQERAAPRPDTGGRQRFTCADCKYRFNSGKPVADLACPYCGSRRIATQSETSADALIHASTDRRFEF